jgi:TonB family protein
MQTQTPTIRITLFEGDKLVREEVFTQKTIRVGKAGQAHLRLNDQNVSRQHCVIEIADSGEVRLTDLESTNGTLVNGVKVSQAVLRPGDEVQIGDTKLRLDFEQATERATSDAFFAPAAVQDMANAKIGLETALLWGEKVLQAKYYPEGTGITIGSTPGVDFFLPADVIGTDLIEFVKADGRQFLVDVSSPKIDGDFLVDGKIIRLPEMQRREQIEQGKWARIDMKTRARLKFGDFTILLGLTHIPQAPKTSWWKKFNMREHMYLVLSLILHLLFLVMVTLVPEEQLKSVRDPYEKRTQALKKIQVAMLERKVEEDQKKAEEAKKLADAQKPGTELTPRPVDEKPTSKLVTEDQVEKNKKIADTALTRVMGQQQDLLNQVLDAAGPGLGGGMMGIRVIGDRGMDAELALGLDAFGGTLGGGGGGGFRGTGAWGGGGEFGAADLRGISGLSKSDAEGAASKIKFKGGGEPMVYTGISTVSGELDKETVRRYIQTKMDQVRWCYQQEVQKNPDLAGQVKIEWIILPTGKVTAVRVGVSSLGSQAVEQCLMSRVATWQFPSPKGGGTVKVSYPFIFRVTGGK